MVRRSSLGLEAAHAVTGVGSIAPAMLLDAFDPASTAT
jgi:hypothetical protein